MMRRFVILFFTAVIISATAMPAFAAKFTPSVEGKAAPEVVSQKGSDGNEYAAIIRDADGNEIKGVPFGDLIVTPVSKADNASESIKKRLETAYKKIKSAKSVTELNSKLEDVVKKVSPDTDIKNVVVRDLFDISTIGDYAKYLQEEGSTITIRFKLSADSAVWDSTMDGWRLRRYTLRNYADGLADQVQTGEKLDTVIALKLNDFYFNEKTVQTLSKHDLDALIDTQKMRGDSNVMYAEIEKNNRYALPFSAFILTIMGVALSSRKKRGGIGWNLGLGIGLAFTYILFMRFSQMFVYAGTLSATVALWLPNFIFAIIAIVLYKKAPK